LLAIQGAGATTPPASIAEKVGGLLGQNQEGMSQQGRPGFQTMIDLRNMENGRPAPLLDQHENHCRIDGHATKDNVTTQRLSCFEFWDGYKSKSSS
jgi:hypothetical protein